MSIRSPFDSAIDGAIDCLSKGRPVVFCVPLHASGSVPTPLSSRMTVAGDHDFYGTVGGGIMEHLVQVQARKLLEEDGKCWEIVTYTMDGMTADSEHMPCGGYVNVLIERFSPDQKSLFECYDSCRKRRWNLLDIIHFPKNESHHPSHVILESGEKTRTIYGDTEYETIRANYPTFDEIIDGVKAKHQKYYENGLFITPIIPRPVIYLYGAGTCGISLCSAAPLGNFDVVVFDDREDQIERLRHETTNKEVESEKTGISDKDILGSGKDGMLESPENSYAVVITRGHKNDLVVLRQLLKLDPQPKYIGMIGSRHKTKTVFDKLLSEGVSERLLETVHAPIGLPIGGDTPGEIAISIMAELIQCRTQGKKGMFPGIHE